MQCEICGCSLKSEGIFIKIEGAQFKVCNRCSKLGVPTTQKKIVPKKITKKKNDFQEVILKELKKDYNKIIKQARENFSLSQEQLAQKMNEKLSVIKLLESGRLIPNDRLAKKLEHVLKIQLLVVPENE